MRQSFHFLILLMLAAGPLAAQQESPSAPRLTTDKYKLDSTDETYRHIRDSAPFPWKVPGRRELGGELDVELKMEGFAYESVLKHAAQFSHSELEGQARRDVLFRNLIDNGRTSYKLDLIRLEGRLRRLTRIDPEPEWKLHNIEAIFEAWIFPPNETTPVCFLCTELPQGLAPQKDLTRDLLDKPVAVTGYYFKLMLYEQRAIDPKQPTKHVLWPAPVLIGRSMTLLPDGALEDGGQAWRSTFVPVAVGGFTLIALILVVLSWRYRRGDRLVRERLRNARNRNPFDGVEGAEGLQ